MTDTPSPSTLAMERFVAASPGLREPRITRAIAGLPTLPDLKKLARDRREARLEVIDQSAGDIADVGQPLAPEFVAWIPEAREQLIAAGSPGLARTAGDAYGYPGNYQQQYPAVVGALARSWGITKTPYQALQTPSGRNVLDFAFRGLLSRARGEGPPALLLDPLAWSGYRPLARDLGITLVELPAVSGFGLGASAEGLRAAIGFAVDQGLDPIGAVTVLPSNPTGVGMEAEELARYAEVGAEVRVPVLIDAFYSPLHPQGHAAAVPMGFLEGRLAPQVLGNLGLIVGETKVTSSQNKTGTVIWMAPQGHEATAQQVVAVAATRMRTTNSYPRPQEALVAYALHSFPGGVHAAMGPRYSALDAARQAMRRAADELGLPLSIGGSFYGTLGLVDSAGRGLVRGADGEVITDPAAVSQALIERFGLVGAPGPMFSSAPEASALVRLTAAVTLDDVAKVRGILASMIADAD